MKPPYKPLLGMGLAVAAGYYTLFGDSPQEHPANREIRNITCHEEYEERLYKNSHANPNATYSVNDIALIKFDPINIASPKSENIELIDLPRPEEMPKWPCHFPGFGFTDLNGDIFNLNYEQTILLYSYCFQTHSTQTRRCKK